MAVGDVTIVGTIYNVDGDLLTGKVKVIANKNFADAAENFHVGSIPFYDTVTNGVLDIVLPSTTYNNYTSRIYTETDILTFTSIITETDDDPITITISDGDGANKDITIVCGSTTEPFENLDMDETVPGTYIVDYINANSTLVNVTRLSETDDDTLPTNIDSQTLSDGTTDNIVNPETVKYNMYFVDENNITIKMIENFQLEYSTTNVNIVDLL